MSTRPTIPASTLHFRALTALLAPAVYHPLARAYFDNKKCETKSLYEKMGVQHFKWLMPSSGDFIMKKLFKAQVFIPTTRAQTRIDVQKYEFATRVLEGIHLTGIVYSAAYMTEHASSQTPASWASAIIGNVLVNVYPILVQRYNRLRTQALLDLWQRQEDRKTAKPQPLANLQLGQ